MKESAIFVLIMNQLTMCIALPFYYVEFPGCWCEITAGRKTTGPISRMLLEEHWRKWGWLSVQAAHWVMLMKRWSVKLILTFIPFRKMWATFRSRELLDDLPWEKMTTKVVYFTVGGKPEQAEFSSEFPADEIKGVRVCVVNTYALLFAPLCWIVVESFVFLASSCVKVISILVVVSLITSSNCMFLWFKANFTNTNRSAGKAIKLTHVIAATLR